jgi:hypothetical protein
VSYARRQDPTIDALAGEVLIFAFVMARGTVGRDGDEEHATLNTAVESPRWSCMVRSLVPALLSTLLGCSGASGPANGVQQCAPATSSPRCPSGYSCQSDNKCWKDGTGPADAAVGGRSSQGGAPSDARVNQALDALTSLGGSAEGQGAGGGSSLTTGAGGGMTRGEVVGGTSGTPVGMAGAGGGITPGGTTASGGVAGKGGTAGIEDASGGASTLGGNVAKGGTTGSSANSASGGATTGSGGTLPAVGGTASTGGMAAAGGATSTGGATAAGGTTGTGANGTGGRSACVFGQSQFGSCVIGP